MPRVRRLAPLVMVAVVGAGLLTGCRSQPSVAVYVADRQYPVQEIESTFRGLAAAVSALPAAQRPEFDLGDFHQNVVSMVVLRDVIRRTAKDRDVSVPATDRAAVRESLGLAPGDSFAQQLETSGYLTLLGDTRTALAALAATVAPADPTEAQQRDVYDSLVALGVNVPFEEVRPSLTRDAIGREVELAGLLRSSIVRYHVVVNPRYAPLTYRIPVRIPTPAGQVSAYVSVPLSGR